MVQRDDVLEREPAEIAHHAEGIGASWLAIATLGNLVGGVGLVTLFRLAQVQQQS